MLSDQQIKQFVTCGHVTVEQAIPREFCKQVTDQAWRRLGYDPADPSTWAKPLIHQHPITARGAGGCPRAPIAPRGL